jgi:predicted amidohydrolase YtcJ
VPEQNITAEQALACYTAVPAYASYQEIRTGTLEVGKLADVVILSQNMLEVAGDKLAETRADITIVNGRVVFSRE